MHNYKRVEGFPGESCCWLSSKMLADIRMHPVARHCYPVSLGFFPQARGHQVNRLRGAPEPSIHIVLEGSGHFTQNGGYHAKVEAPAIVWLEADVFHSYAAAEDRPWTIAWVHLAGSQYADYMKLLGSPCTTLKLHSASSVKAEFMNLLATAKSEFEAELNYPLKLHLKLTALIGILIDAVVEPVVSKAAQARLERLESYLQRNLTRHVPLSEMADVVEWSPSHLNAIFRKMYGNTPASYFMQLRMVKACELLRHTSMNLAAIAERLGFDDPFYFSRCFKRCYGRSPSNYRQL